MKIQALTNNLHSLYFSSRKKVPLYTFDKDGNYQRFESSKEAAQYFNISRQSISKALKEEAHILDNIAVPVSKVEDKQGQIDEAKLRALQANILKNGIDIHHGKNNPVYALTEDGFYQKFSSQKEASKQLGVTQTQISGYKNSKTPIRGYLFTAPEDIEDKNHKVSQRKIASLMNKFNTPGQGKPEEVYLVDRYGEYQKFYSHKDAAQYLEVGSSAITNALRNFSKIQGMRIAKAQYIEREDGSVDEEKIKRIAASISPKPIYLKSRLGSIFEFNNMNKAQNATGLSINQIKRLMKNPDLEIRGYRIYTPEE